MRSSSKPGSRWRRLGSLPGQMERPTPGGGGEMNQENESKNEKGSLRRERKGIA